MLKFHISIQVTHMFTKLITICKFLTGPTKIGRDETN